MTTTQTATHLMNCWAGALFDTAENIIEDGREATHEQVRREAYDVKVDGLSTCICHEDDEWYARNTDREDEREYVTIEVAARYYSFASDLEEV